MWINNNPVCRATIENPAFLNEWREHQYSLTDKLEQKTGSSSLNLLAQEWVRPSWWDRYLLGIKDESMLQREIIMQHQSQSYWYARTIIPKPCYEQHADFFKRLQQESLRELLFHNPKVQRLQFINYPVDRHCLEFYWVKKYLPAVEDLLWVRLAEFSLKPFSFYLIEILLPQLQELS
jgi:chorismate--pyruvate lyase